MASIFAEMQQATLITDTIPKLRSDLNEFVEYMTSLDWQEKYITGFAKMRKLTPEIFKEHKCFFIPEGTIIHTIPEKFWHDRYGMVKGSRIVYDGRFIYPVFDVKGDVMGFCGYDNEFEPKYLDSTNYGYKAKEASLYGMERLSQYYKDGTVIIFEGIPDTLWARQNGLPAMASLGSYLTPYVIQILKRFGSRCIIVTDADEAGTKYRKQVRRVLPKARVLQSSLAKDPDDTRKISLEVEQDLLNDFQALIRNPLSRCKILF